MLVNLLKYEFIKKWKNVRYVALAYTLIQLAIVIIARGFFWKEDITQIFIDNSDKPQDIGFFFIMLMALYFILAGILLLFPFFESIRRFEKDLDGKQAPLELMIPAASWQKITSKLITTVCSTVICGVIAIFSIIIFIFIMRNFEKSVVDSFFNILKEVINGPAKTIFVLISALFGFASTYILFFFCIAVSKWASHKNKIAVPISIGIFVLCISIMIVLGIQTEKFPIVTFNLFGIDYSLSSTIIDIIFFALPFIGTAWVMEKKIEN